MRSRLPPTFAQRLIFYGLSIAIPVFAMCGVLIHEYTDEQYRSIEAQTLAAAHELASDIDREIQSQIILLESLSGILGPEMDLARLHQNATETIVPHGSHVVVYDIGGWQILNTAVPIGQPIRMVAQPDRIREIIEGKAPYVSNLKPAFFDNRPVWLVGVPLRPQSEVVGLIGLSKTPEQLAAALEKKSRPAHWRWFVVDRDNVVVANRTMDAVGRTMPAHFAKASKGQSGVNWLQDSEGIPIVLAYARSELSGWLVAVAVPQAVIEAPLREAWMLFAMGAAVLLALAFLLAASAAHKLHANVDVLVESAEKLGRGELLPHQSFDTREFQRIHDALVSAYTERERSEERRHLLLRELQHRTNNLLAVIASIARRTLLDDGRTMEEARNALLGRIQALANASDTLADAHWQGADMHRVIESEMRVFAGRYTVDGPNLLLSAQAAQNMSLVIHELATNASKHGALSHPDGNVSISWRIQDDRESEPLLIFEWVERGVPAQPPSRRGFGYTLLQTVLSDAEHKPEMRFDPDGLFYRATVRLRTVLADASKAIPRVPGLVPDKGRSGDCVCTGACTTRNDPAKVRTPN